MAKRRNIHDIMGKVVAKQITKPTLLYRDRAGNTLWCKFIKCRGNLQVFGRNAEGKLVDEYGVAVLMEESGHNDPRNGYMVTPESDRARRMMDHGANHQARGRR